MAVKWFKETVSDELQHRFFVSPESVAVIAAAVDPRYQQLNDSEMSFLLGATASTQDKHPS